MNFLNLRVVKYSPGLPPYVGGSWFCPDGKHPNLGAARQLLAEARQEEPGDWRLETRGEAGYWRRIDAES